MMDSIQLIIPSLLGLGEAAVTYEGGGGGRCQFSWNLFAECHCILRVNVAFAYNK